MVIMLLMEEILHQLISTLSYDLLGFIHPGGAGFLPSTVLPIYVGVELDLMKWADHNPTRSMRLVYFPT